jgi:hypothetical protein
MGKDVNQERRKIETKVEVAMTRTAKGMGRMLSIRKT